MATYNFETLSFPELHDLNIPKKTTVYFTSRAWGKREICKTNIINAMYMFRRTEGISYVHEGDISESFMFYSETNTFHRTKEKIAFIFTRACEALRLKAQKSNFERYKGATVEDHEFMINSAMDCILTLEKNKDKIYF